jgi:hypothetical protein
MTGRKQTTDIMVSKKFKLEGYPALLTIKPAGHDEFGDPYYHIEDVLEAYGLTAQEAIEILDKALKEN